MEDNNFLKQIYEFYKEEEADYKIEDTEEINLEDGYSKFIEKAKRKNINKETKLDPLKEYSFGDVFLNREGIYYLILSKLDKNFVEVCKVSYFIELATHKDLIVQLEESEVIIELWNIFFLDEKDIKESVYIGRIQGEDISIIKNFIMNKAPLPYEKVGFEVPEDEGEYVQNKFHIDEENIVKKYKILQKNDKIILFPPFLLVNFIEKNFKAPSFAAAKEKLSAKGKNFLLFADKMRKTIEIVLPQELLKKNIEIYIDDKLIYREKAKDKLIIKGVSVDKIDVDRFATSLFIKEV